MKLGDYMNNKDIDEVRKNYNLYKNVKRYGNAIDEVGLWESEKIIFNKYIKLEDRILDIGCGAGRTTINLYKNGYKNIEGLDLSEELIKYANNYCNKFKLDIKFIVGNAMDLQYPDNSFDVVIFSYNGMMCIPGYKNRKKVLEEVYRILKPGGIYIFTAHNRDDSGKHNKEWEEEKILWGKGLQDPELEIYGDKYPIDITGEKIFLHFSNIEEMKELVESVDFKIVEYVKSSDIAIEKEKTKEFAGVTVFWVVKK